ncbi:EcsC family protein, partial [Streptomyces koyangensis]|uniref:EcsC family protein n=1 Tax=Streptomyces koyangensis TaxID=188770 RepID=UPI003D025D04
MSTHADPIVDGATPMSAYEGQVWDKLNEHWQRRNNRRGLPNWASAAIGRTGEVAGNAVRRVTDAVPEVVTEPIRRAGDAVADKAMRPALTAAAAMLELVNDWAMELNDPKNVEKLARKRGFDIDSFSELRGQDLKVCDQLLTSNTLKWRTAGAFEGGAMGLLAMVPVAGIPVALTADILVIQVLSTSIASRIAYSYGYDAKDPGEQVFIQRLVQRSFVAQAAKVKPLSDTARAASAVKGRIRWSDNLRKDHRLLAALEKLMQQLGPAGARGPVKNVAKVVPFVGVLIGAGMNSAVLGNVAADARRYCQTRFLCEKYGLPLPTALASDRDEDDPQTDAT